MNTNLLHKRAQHWGVVQQELIPQLTTDLGPLSGSLLTVIRTLEWARIDEFVDRRWCGIGRPLKEALARAFVAKAVLRLTTTEDLRERLQMDRALQRICDFDSRKPVPDAATFSRAFAEMAAGRVGERCHQALIDAHLGDQLIGHITRDGTAIEAREKPAPSKKAAAEKMVVKPKHSRTSQEGRVPPGAGTDPLATATHPSAGGHGARSAAPMRPRQQIQCAGL